MPKEQIKHHQYRRQYANGHRVFDKYANVSLHQINVNQIQAVAPQNHKDHNFRGAHPLYLPKKWHNEGEARLFLPYTQRNQSLQFAEYLYYYA